jgi:hypothetical protein
MRTFKKTALLLLAMMIISISSLTPAFAAGENYIPGYFGWIGNDVEIPETIANGNIIEVEFTNYADPQAWGSLAAALFTIDTKDYSDFLVWPPVGRSHQDGQFGLLFLSNFEMEVSIFGVQHHVDETTGYGGKIILSFIVKNADALKEAIQSSPGKKLPVNISHTIVSAETKREDGGYLIKGYSSLAETVPLNRMPEKGHTKFIPATIRMEGPNTETYTVNYNVNGGDGFIKSQTVETGAPVTVAQNTFEKDGAEFTGWNTRTNGAGTPYSPGQSVTDIAEANDSVTLYAQWEGGETPPDGGGSGETPGSGGDGETSSGGGSEQGNTVRYTLSYETNGGSKVSSMPVDLGQTVGLHQPSFKTGSLLLGWCKDKELTNMVSSVTITGDTTVYAKWGTQEELDAQRAEEAAAEAAAAPDATSPLTQDMLNKSDHFAYVGGYPEGDVRPENNITRAEAGMIFYRLLKDAVREYAYVETGHFSDVLPGDWHSTAISTMANLKILNGDGDGAFRPDDFITRAEFAAIVARFDSDVYSGANKFDDLAGHWAAEPVNRSADKGWVTGYEDGTFMPEQYIIRAEAMTIINRVLERDKVRESGMADDMVHWPDNLPSNWYYAAVQEATNSHEFERDADGYEIWTQLR